MIFDAFPYSFPLSLSHPLKNGDGKESKGFPFRKVWESLGNGKGFVKQRETNRRNIDPILLSIYGYDLRQKDTAFIVTKR